MKYIIIDALLNGTGIRDKYKGGYIDPRSLGLSGVTIVRLNNWLSEYWEEHYNGYIDGAIIDALDEYLLSQNLVNNYEYEYFYRNRF